MGRLSTDLKRTQKQIDPNMFENEKAQSKRKQLVENEKYADHLLGKKRLFGDEMGQHGPMKYLDVVREEKWLGTRAPMSVKQKKDMLKFKADIRIGAITFGDVNRQEELKHSEKAKAKQQISIAKDLFLIWDGDGEGSLSPEELMNAFVRIGLS